MTVRQMLDHIDARELSEWMAYYRVNPFGDERRDLNSACQQATMANVLGNRKKRYTPKDFMIRFGAREQQDADSIIAQFRKFSHLTESMRRADHR